MRNVLLRGVLAATLCGVVAVAAPARAGPPSIDWPTAAFDRTRAGDNTAETTISTSNVTQLAPSWTVWVDGAVITAQPVVAANVPGYNGSHDLIYVGTEHGTISALDSATGTTVWTRNTGYQRVGCGDLPNGDFGISSSAAFDRPSNTLYSMGGDGKLYAFVAGTGAVLPGWPVTIVSNPSVEHVYGALNVVNGSVYVITASMCDNGTYHGRIVQVATASAKVAKRLYIDGSVADANGNITSPGPGGGGVWGAAGVSIDVAGAYVYAATGNLNGPEDESSGYGNHVLKMLPDLSVVASASPPLGCAHCDLDFGSTPVLFHPVGCYPRFAALNKNHEVYVYRRDPFTTAPVATLFNNEYVGEVAYDARTQTMVSANLDGMRAYVFDSGCVPHVTWSIPGTSGPGGQLGQAVSPPAMANGIAYYGNGAGATLYAVEVATGKLLWQHILGGSIFAQPTVVNGMVVVAAWDGNVTALRTTGGSLGAGPSPPWWWW